MDLTEVKKKMQGVESLATTLGLEFISTPDPDTLEATMQVTPAVSQPFGVLNGGWPLPRMWLAWAAMPCVPTACRWG